jgi:hypothetical protein
VRRTLRPELVEGLKGASHVFITMLIALKLLAFFFGVALIFFALKSAVKTFVLPRAAPDGITKFVFRSLRRFFNGLCLSVETYLQRDRIMSFYAPVALVLLVPVLLFIIDVGFTLVYWAITDLNLEHAFSLSGSSLMTLGFIAPPDLLTRILSFGEAAIGMILVALLIAYLPTIYSVFSQRELVVSAWETRAGAPPWAITMIERAFLLDRMEELRGIWDEWERWFVQLEETHTSLSSVIFFRSQRPNRSWITAAGSVLDAASFVRAAVNIEPDPHADLMIRAGYLSLRYIIEPYGAKLKRDLHYPEDPISIERREFDHAFNHLLAMGVPMRPDRDQAWRDFAGWRVNYDAALLMLCDLVMAPEAPWSSDRSAGRWYLTPKFKNRNIALDEATLYRERKESELPNIDSSDTAHDSNAERMRRLDRRLLNRRLIRQGRDRRATPNSQPNSQLRSVRKRRADD